MIVFPKNWNAIGCHIGIQEIETRLRKVIWSIGCNCLSFSGGLDSSLLLYYMCSVREPISLDYPRAVPVICFTAGRPVKDGLILKEHPDVTYSKEVVKYFRKKFEHIDITHYIFHLGEDEKGNGIKLFYEFIAKRANEIIAGDGIDEFMGGYYDHQFSWINRSQTYYDRIWGLQKDHLIPLNENSGKVRVYLPYIDDSLINLYTQIPLSEKVDDTARKKVMVALAKGKVPDEILLRRKYGFCDVS